MNLNYLLYFQTLAKYEHYGKAAEELHITQPSLSKAIRNLEQDLGVELFEKSGRGIRLSSQGVHYLDYVDKALHELRLGNDILRYEKASFDAFVPIGLVLPAASSVFSRWVKDFQAGFRGKVFFSCKNGTTKQLVLALKNGSVDLVICSEVKDPRIEMTPLYSTDLVLLVPPGHRFTGRKSVRLRELEGESFVAHSRGSVLHDMLADIYRRNNLNVSIVSEADENAAIIAMVRAGLGCGVMPRSEEVSRSAFGAIPIRDSGFDTRICIGRMKDRAISDAACAFYRHVAGQSTITG